MVKCWKTASIKSVLWKNYNYVLRFVKKQQVWFWFCEKTSSMISKNGRFPIETNVNYILPKCEKTASMIFILWKTNNYDFTFVKKQRVWFYFCEKTTSLILRNCAALNYKVKKIHWNTSSYNIEQKHNYNLSIVKKPERMADNYD